MVEETKKEVKGFAKKVKEVGRTVLKKVGRTVLKEGSKAIRKSYSEKALRRPKAKIKSISAERIIARTPYTPLVQPGEEGYFKKEFNQEVKWLSK